MWVLREEGVAETARHGTVVLFDISLKIGDMEHFVGAIESALKARFGAKTGVWIYGHPGDGNLRINVDVHSGEPANEVRHAVEDIVDAPLATLGASVSAEHGICLHKKGILNLSRSSAEINVIRQLKGALDPRSILNPDKFFDFGLR